MKAVLTLGYTVVRDSLPSQGAPLAMVLWGMVMWSALVPTGLATTIANVALR